jgi:hypothetical protein
MKNKTPAVQPEDRGIVSLSLSIRKKKKFAVPVFLSFLLLSACVNQNKKIIFHPDPGQEQAPLPETINITESKNGTASAPLPEWLGRFLSGGIGEVEALEPYQNKYVFIGKNRGTHFKALEQWAEGFTVFQDFPRLVAARLENRMLAPAALYPDDEYGAYFETLIKNASGAEYSPTLKEDTFWIKRRIERESGDEAQVLEIYEFFVLISIDKALLQSRVRELMANAKPAIPPTRAQSAAINRVQQNFFEGF